MPEPLLPRALRGRKGASTRRVGRRKRSAETGPGTEERLITAAAAAFGRYGYERARLEDVAAQAGITRPSLLHHFSSKRALYEAALAHALEALERDVTAALVVMDAYDERVRGLMTALIAFNEGHQELVAMLFRGVLREEDVTARNAVRAHFLPMVDRMEAFVRFGSEPQLGADYPVREAILSMIVTQLAHSALGDFGRELWKGEPATLRLTEALLLPSTRASLEGGGGGDGDPEGRGEGADA